MTHLIDFTRRPSASNRIRVQVTLAAGRRQTLFFFFPLTTSSAIVEALYKQLQKDDEVNSKGSFN